jgi:pyroglutamyl-peptidase
MRILVYGFGPYRRFKNNITKEIVRKLPASRNLKKIIFPVRFHKRQFINAVKRRRPDIVLGLGQCSTGRMLRIERRAINKKRNTKNEKPHAIARGGSKWLPTSLKLEKSPWDKQAKMSYDAGDYVCNFSMYVILDYLRRCRPKTRFGFIHVPHDYDPARAEVFLARLVGKLRQSVNRGVSLSWLSRNR